MAFSLYLSRQYIPFYLILIAGAMALSFFSYRRVRDELPKRWLAVFIFLRCLLFFLVFSALFALTLQIRFSIKQEPLVAVLLDYSGSMDEEEQDSTRLALAKQYMSHTLLPHVGNRARVAFFLFSDNLYQRGDTAQANRTSTMIGTCLDKVTALCSPAPSALFLLSDGRNTSGKDPLLVAERIPFPIYTIGIGESNRENNLCMSGIRVNPIVYLGDSVPVSVILSNRGAERKNVSIALVKRGATIARKTIPSIEPGIELPVQLFFVPEQEGIQSYEARAESFKGEKNTDDNRRSLSVRVLKKRKKVILLCHQLNWDYRFLQAFLASQKDVEPYCTAMISNDTFLIQHRGKIKKGSLARDMILPADVVILINPQGIDQELFDAIIGDVFQSGTGLLIMGNKLPEFSSFREVYPLLISKGIAPGDAVPVPTTNGKRTNLFRIEGLVPETFPPLSNPLLVRMAKPNALIYLETTSSKGGAPLPLFSSITYGKGRIAALSAENLWHWKTLPLATGAEHPPPYDAIMNNILKWLIARRETERLVLSCERTKLLWGEEPTISAALYDDMGNPQEGGIIVLHVEQDTTSVAEYTMKDVGTGNYEKELPLLAPGTYTVRAEARYPERIQNRPSFTLEVEAREIEKLNTEPDHLLLRNIAEASGGTYLGRSAGLSRIPLASSPVLVQKRFSFSDGFIPFLLIAMIFSLELMLRKRKGLR